MKSYSRRLFLARSACAGMSSLPLLNTLLNLRLMEGVSAASTPAAGEYRALVCVFLAGGNDSYNMLVPRESSAFQVYTQVRGPVALPAAQIRDIQPEGLPKFGVHNQLSALANLFNAGKLAFVANVGTLIEPVENAHQVEQQLKRLPRGLYSHADQVEQWQTGVASSAGATGWGGRMADLLRELNPHIKVPMNISLDGSVRFLSGLIEADFAITPEGPVNFTDYNDSWEASQDVRNTLSAAIDSQLAQEHHNLLAQAFTARLRQARDFNATIAGVGAGGLPGNELFSNQPLSQRLRMVAKIIQARAQLGAVRQTFFVQLPGWDHHNNLLTNHNMLLGQLGSALNAFQNSMDLQGLSKNVTLFTVSDFGRTLTANSDGSDHAWGGNHIVMGGAVAGKRIYGAYPDLLIGSNLDTGRGRLIPTTSCEQYFAELALWLGVKKSDLPLVLPNIGNFYSVTSTDAPMGFMS